MERYTVQKGDTLAKIAMHYYGDPTEWRRIYKANRSSIKNPNVILVGQRLDIPTEMDCRKQRSMMSPPEQLRCPEEGLSYPIEFEVLELLVGATALLKGLLKAGVRVFSKKAAKNADDVFKSVVNSKTGKKEWPNSPYGKDKDPKEMMETINKQIRKDMENVDPRKIGRQNAEIERIHKEFIETGKWPLKHKNLGDYHMSTPGPRLMKARQEFLKALKEHKH